MLKNPSLLLVLLLLATTAFCQTQPPSEQEKNKTVARLFLEDVLGQGRLDQYSDSHTADFVAHGTDRDFSLAEDMAAAREERTAMPDMQMAVNRMVAEGDLVAVHWTAWGTNTQPGMGLPATGKKIKVSGITIFRFKAAKISEEWSAWNMLSVLKQAGLFPPNP
ncbi:MAG TPA: ester cyclase [Terriglobales bacterium]|nr:ester cyclase [Terriglobales bacterium]